MVSQRFFFKGLTIFLLIVILIGVFYVFVLERFFSAVFPECKPSEACSKECTQDSDCVPRACCHPAETINKKYAPKCEEVVCTMNCAGPLDCGCGEPACVNNQCSIRKLGSESWCP